MVYSLEQIKTRAFIIVVAVLVPTILVSLAFNLFRFKKERTYQKGKLYYPMAIALVAAMCGGICFAPYNKMWTFVVLGVGIGLYLLYFLCLNCVNGDRRDLFCRILFTASLIVCVETLIWFLRRADFLATLKCEDIRVGWGMKNTMPLILNMAAPATVYLGLTRRQYSFAMFPVLALFSGILFLTMSRGNILFGFPILIVCWVIGLIKSDNKVRLIACITAIGCIAFVFVSMPVLRIISDKLFYSHKGGFFDDNGRAPLYKQALEHFFANPVFGVGYFKYKGAFAYDGPSTTFLWKSHNTVFQILCCNGLVGVIGLMPFFSARYRLLLNDFSLFKLLALMSLVAYELEGMVDVAFLSIHELFFLIGLFAAAETESSSSTKISQKFCFMQKMPFGS